MTRRNRTGLRIPGRGTENYYQIPAGDPGSRTVDRTENDENGTEFGDEGSGQDSTPPPHHSLHSIPYHSTNNAISYHSIDGHSPSPNQCPSDIINWVVGNRCLMIMCPIPLPIRPFNGGTECGMSHSYLPAWVDSAVCLPGTGGLLPG